VAFPTRYRILDTLDHLGGEATAEQIGTRLGMTTASAAGFLKTMKGRQVIAEPLRSNTGERCHEAQTWRLIPISVPPVAGRVQPPRT